MSRENGNWAEICGEHSKFNVETNINRTYDIILLSFGEYMRILRDFRVVMDVIAHDTKRIGYAPGEMWARRRRSSLRNQYTLCIVFFR